MDLRYLRKAKFGSDQRCPILAGVLSFLEGVYNSVAETLPDVRDGPCDEDADDPMDPYAGGDSLLELVLKKSAGNGKVKLHKRGVEVCPTRTTASGCEIRFLPPGTVKDYWVQYKQVQESDGNVASFPTFWRVGFGCGTFLLPC